MTGPPDVAARRRRVAVAGHRGDATTARTHLTDPAPVVRATALRALARASALDLAEVARAAGDPEPLVRRAAAELAATWPSDDPIVTEVVCSLLDDPETIVAETAAWAAGERSGPQPVLVARLVGVVTGHQDHLVREAAVAALGALGDEAGLPAVLAATGDRATVRRRAVLALAPFDGPEVDAALRRARHDRDRQVRQAAEDLLD